MKPVEIICQVVRQKELAEGIFQLDLHAPEIAAQAVPGQFVNLYCQEKDRLLPRPISIYDAEGDTLSLIYAVVGKGTEEFSVLTEGDALRIVGPLGNGFPLESLKEADEVILIGGGLGIPPMHFAMKEAAKRYPQVKRTAILGYRSTPWLSEPFAAYGEVLEASDDGACGFKGNVVDRLQAYLREEKPAHRVVFSCGPIPMMRAIQNVQEELQLTTWFSLEERMGCGFGACYGCPVRLKTEDGSVLKRVCKDGPVFPGKDVIFS